MKSTVNSLDIEDAPNTYSKLPLHSINSLTDCQKSSIKDHLVDSYNKLHGISHPFPLSTLNLPWALES